MNVKLRTLAASVVILLMAGCAQLSPQQVAFTPELDVTALPQGNGTTVSVNVRDNRPDNAIGRRGGTYPESSVITPRGNLRDTLQRITNEYIAEAGYSQVEMDPEVEITVSLDELTYDLEDIDAVRKSATAAAKVSIQLVRDASMYSNSFRAQRTIETFRYPSTEQNAELLNQVFEAALQRMFNDEGLTNFLNR